MMEKSYRWYGFVMTLSLPLGAALGVWLAIGLYSGNPVVYSLLQNFANIIRFIQGLL